MTVIDVQQDPAGRTLKISTRFDAPPARVWQIWQDPRQLERWWGPPTYPATVIDHDLSPGGSVTYFMTSPEGDKHYGWWRVTSAEAPHRLEFEDGFADDAGRPNLDLPTTTVRVQLTADGEAATVMTIESNFPSTEAMEQMVAMGMVEGMSAALGQIEALLAEPTAD
ncbi:SRPBCC family protein [Frankia tisae]|uniref:SRPBCC family protein n=1 Tax=Frankia tisae TaxID=2950104 RepID=UPI0021C1473B|nr:SRPBCC domain-containing protein [Frankia tisae]